MFRIKVCKQCDIKRKKGEIKWAKGMCQKCYRKNQIERYKIYPPIKKEIMIICKKCGIERKEGEKRWAKGLCLKCYGKQYNDKKYLEHRDEILARQRENNKKHKAEKSKYNKDYRKENKTELDIYDDLYYLKNKKRILKRKKKQYQKDKGKVALYNKRKRKENPEKTRLREHEKTLKRKRGIEIIDHIIKVLLMDKFDWKCIWCVIFGCEHPELKNDRHAHMDHLSPVVAYRRIGKKCPHSWSNVGLSCEHHNSEKHDKLPLNYIWDKLLEIER